MNNMLLLEDSADDHLDRAKSILCFVQSWSGLSMGNYEPSVEELYGLSLTLEAAALLISQAQEIIGNKT